MAIVECVPNFSEGRDARKVEAIRNVIAISPGVAVLRSEQDPDHNRCVITFAGGPESVFEAAFQAVRLAIGLIDLRSHSGVHPRIGAADVVPFVPVDGVTMADCVQLARRLGRRVWRELGVPVYFYEGAATQPERIALENVRRGGFEHPALVPDLGGPELHPTAGACVIGARQFLIAFNINLATSNVQIAREIARAIRTSSGGLPFVKAMGVLLKSRNLAQVSMNLTDFEQTPIHVVFERVRQEALQRGVEIAGSEIVGLVPRKALETASAQSLRLENFSSAFILEDRLAGLL